MILLSVLQVLTYLEYLDLWGSEISNSGAAILEMFPRLNFLNLAWTKVTKVPYLPSVAYLNMSSCTVLSLFHGQTRAKVPLSKLLLTGASVNDISKILTNVEAGCMTFLDISGSSIINFDFMVNMRQLEHLDLSSSGMSDSFIEHIINIGENLRCLNLSRTKITSQGISALSEHVPRLESLILSYTAIDDVSLSYISLMSSLRAVDLSHTKVKGGMLALALLF